MFKKENSEEQQWITTFFIHGVITGEMERVCFEARWLLFCKHYYVHFISLFNLRTF